MKRLLADADKLELTPWVGALASLIASKKRFITIVDGKARLYRQVLETLPQARPSSVDLDAEWVRIGEASDLDEEEKKKLREALADLCPWRKGPFRVFGVDLDTEWRSSLKWSRLAGRIAPLSGRRVLDIGSSCGYYLFRMARQEPKMVLGIEPYMTFYFQYKLLQHYIGAPNIYCLPVRLEEMPAMPGYFDTVFSMGILYHRRSPIDALKQLRAGMRKGGELVLETLVIEGEKEIALSPSGRYAKMNNVYFLPTVSCLEGWLRRAGFENVRCIDVTATTSEEQRKTEWVQTESLEDFLDPADPALTVEGHPAPLRAILLAEAK